MDISVIIISFNTKELTQECVKSVIKNTKGISFELVVIDNGSTDGSAEMLRKLKLKLVENKKNLGFARANNQGIKKVGGKYVLFLNSDTLVGSNVLGEMVKWMDENEKVGVATCTLKNKDGSLQGTGGYFPSLVRVFSWMTIQDLPLVDRIIRPFHPMKSKSISGGEGFYRKAREMDWVTGAFLMVRREVLEAGVKWDEDYFMYTEDVDFCYQVKNLGWKVMYLPKWSITHLGGASSTAEYPILSEYEGVKTFYRKHYPGWQRPVLRVFLKIGALGRMVVLGILEGKETFRIYAKAFWQA